ncbi:hypothetical protein Dimus_032076, partial [Dionaea muscipula]
MNRNMKHNLREKKWIPLGNVQSVAQKLAQKRKHPTDIFEGVHERQQLTIGKRTSLRQKQMYEPQNPLHDEAHAEQHQIEVDEQLTIGRRSSPMKKQQLTIGRRSSPKKKQVHGPQNSLDGEAHTKEAAEIVEKRERARKKAENRAKQTDMHTCGKKSFAMIRENLIQANEEKKEPSNAEMFRATRKRVSGRTYKEAIMGKERSGRVRLYERGVTASSLGKTSTKSNSASVYVLDELIQSIKDDVAAQVMDELETEVTQQ